MAGLIVHEWIETHGGAERVVNALAEHFSDAPVIAPWVDPTDAFAGGRVRESWMARTPLRHHKVASTPFLLGWWRTLPATDADWMLCCSHLFAHHARMRRPSRDVPKFVYAYSPARSLWEPQIDDRAGGLVRTVARPLRLLDRSRSREPVRIAAVSRFIANRIERSWGRESTVIHPPVDLLPLSSQDPLTQAEQAIVDSLPAVFILGASRFVRYKRLDLVIAAGAASDLPVVLAGDGPDYARLREIADEHPGRVTFVRSPSDALLRAIYRSAAVYVFPPVEDFGIMPIEAMAAGTPVVGNAVGGTAETVVDGTTGILFHSDAPSELARAIELALVLSPDACRNRAQDFDGATFATRIATWIRGGL